MPLVHNSKESLFGGVNQQAAEYRLGTQVEEMINAYPTIDQGLLRRNPTVKKTLTQNITFDDDIWTYEYDRGFTDDSPEKYAINITNDGVEIINTVDGTVYNETSGLTYEGNAREYVYPFIGSNGYAATTVKDTTFLVNKNRTPTLFNTDYASDATPVLKDYSFSVTPLVKAPARSWGGTFYDTNLPQRGFCPAVMVAYQRPMSGRQGSGTLYYDVIVGSSTLTVIVDGTSIVIKTPKLELGHATYLYSPQDSARSMSRLVSQIESLNSWYARAENAIRDALDPNTYSVERADDYNGLPTDFPPIRITRWDEAVVLSSFSLVLEDVNRPTTLYGDNGQSKLSSVASDYIGTTTYGLYNTSYTPPKSDYQKDGFIWIKRSDPTSGYTYTYTVVDTLNNSKSGTATGTTTDAVATTIATAINADANFSATSVGSVVRVSAIAVDADMVRVDAGDSYGNQASFGWAQEVATANDLPKNLGYAGSLVKVIGTSENAFAAYWLVYTDGQWRETIDPSSRIKINADTMPHVLVRNADNTFTLKAYDGWADKAVGDDETNKPASFLSTLTNASPTIKDIFFFKNRLGFMTSRTVVLSEVGEYGNFWRTTVATLLDSDRIDATVDTTKAIELEYATYLEDSVMLFSDIQFRLQGGDILSPKNVQISQTSAFEINRKVRPVFMNDRVFFCVIRGEHTAVMEYFVSESASAKSEANDITAHVQTYIPKDITKLSGSAINNMLFLISPSTPDTVYIYKYYDSGRERIQSAWFKWTFNGTLYSAFSFGQYLNIMIERIQSINVEDWVMATGVWEGSKLWKGDQLWIGSPSELSLTDQFEQVEITPKDFLETRFIDDDRLVEDKSIIDGFGINGTYVSGEVLSREDFTILLTEDIDFVFDQYLNAGSFTYTIYRDDGTTYTATATDETQLVITVPKSLANQIVKITATPAYGVVTTGQISPMAAYPTGTTENNLLQHLQTYGWYVDGVAVPADPLIDNQGAWFKVYGQSNVGALIQTRVDLGEWVLDTGGKKETRGHLKFKTAEISSEEGSQFSLEISDISRNTLRNVSSTYTVDRKPMIYGDAKHVRLAIISTEEVGFKINMLSYEGNFNIRSRRT